MIVLTDERIEQLRTPHGGFNKEAMEIIGVWPLTSGWKRRLAGTSISNRNWSLALRAKERKRHIFRGNAGRRQ